MTNAELVAIAEKSLDRILGFFSRVESKGSVLLAINTTMLAVLGGNAPPIKYFTEWYMFVFVVPLLLICFSFWHLYKISFPNLEGGISSLIYFREITKRTESKYVDDFKNIKDDEYLNDLLSQGWRNSEILKEKFNHLKFAFILLAISILPWAISLSIFVTKNKLTTSLIK
jgi:hypothetical protein